MSPFCFLTGIRKGEEQGTFRDRFSTAYAAHLTVWTTLYPGVRQTLDRLSYLRKFVFSNKRAELVVQIPGL
jgi:hypothetical protein